MTIHWKALKEHLLSGGVVPQLLQLGIFRGRFILKNFSETHQSSFKSKLLSV
jgi:hypothetical protein